MPSALATTRSIGVVTNPRTRSASAPTYTVVIWITAMSLRGYCRTLNDRIACSPAIRMTRFTTIANTGRLTNKSVNFMSASQNLEKEKPPGTPLLAAVVRSGYSCGMRHLAVFRLGAGIVVRFYVVIDHHRRPITQLEHSRAHHFFPGIQTGYHRDLIAPRSFHLHNLLLHTAVGVTLRVLQVGDDIHRIPVRRIVNRRGE